jgi:hypothetical protein
MGEAISKRCPETEDCDAQCSGGLLSLCRDQDLAHRATVGLGTERVRGFMPPPVGGLLRPTIGSVEA